MRVFITRSSIITDALMSTMGIGSTSVLAVGEERSEDALDYVISQ